MSEPSNGLESLGPRPARPTHDPTAQLSAARAGVLNALFESVEPATVQQLARTVHQHANTVREHLDSLVQLELAQRIPGVAVGRGRPAIRYRAVPLETVRPQIREYATLASVLAAQLAQVSRDPAGDAIAAGMAWGEQLGAEGPLGDDGARTRVLATLHSLGFAPVEQPDGSVDLQECPLLEAARANPVIVCAVHLGLVRALQMAHDAAPHEVTLEPFAKQGACRLRFSADSARGANGSHGKQSRPADLRATPDCQTGTVGTTARTCAGGDQNEAHQIDQ